MARELQPDIILLDIGLPHLNGIEAARRIRQGPPHVHIVFVTLEGDKEIKVTGYVQKSNIASELVPTIAAALADHYPVAS